MKKLFLGILALFLILVSGVNAVDFTAISTPQTWNQAYPWTLDLKTFSTGLTGTITYSIENRTGNENDEIKISLDASTGIATFTFGKKTWVGENKVTFKATNNATPAQSVISNEITLKKEVPNYCDATDGRDIDLDLLDIDFNDEKYKIGDTVNVDVKDVTSLVDDLEDVGVEVCLYNIDQKEEIDCWESEDTFDLDDGEDEDYGLEFNIPNSEYIGKKDYYKLIAIITGDSGKDQCVQASEEIEIERETHDVVVSDVTLSPVVAKAGETVQVTVKLENIGTKDEEDVYVKLKEDLLKVDLESSKFDLDNYEDSDNTNTVRFVITIPEDAKLQDYSLEPVVYFDDGDETNGGKFGALKIEKAVVEVKKAPFEVTTTDTKIDATKGKTTSLQLVITSNEADDVDATVELAAIGNWAEAIAPQAVSLHNGENNIYLPLTLKEATAGMHTATVTIKPVGTSTFAVKQSTLSFEVAGETTTPVTTTPTGLTTAVSGLKGSSMFWIIGDVVLVIVALFFIKAIFFGKKE